MPDESLRNNLNENIPIENIYYMLSYILDTPIPSVVKNILPEDIDDAYNFYASLLSRDIDYILKQGLYREYLDVCEDIPTVRGKINMGGTIKNKFSHKRLLNCEHDELLDNILLNRILKTTIIFLIHNSQVDQKYKQDLRKTLRRFCNVEEIEPALILWGSINFHQNNMYYRYLLSLCRLTLENLLLTDKKGGKRLVTFDLYDEGFSFYEKFLIAYYKKKFKNLFVEHRGFPWTLDDENRKYLPGMEFDIMLTDGHRSLIIDAKYCKKILNPGRNPENLTLNSDNLYQIFAYVKNWEAELKKPNSKLFERKATKFKYDEHPVVAGMLMYAKTKEKIDEPIMYKMSGNDIHVKILDLNCKPPKIDAQLNEVVYKFFPHLFKRGGSFVSEKATCG